MSSIAGLGTAANSDHGAKDQRYGCPLDSEHETAASVDTQPTPGDCADYRSALQRFQALSSHIAGPSRSIGTVPPDSSATRATRARM